MNSLSHLPRWLSPLVLLAGACGLDSSIAGAGGGGASASSVSEPTAEARAALTAGAGSVGSCNGNPARCTAVNLAAGHDHTVALKLAVMAIVQAARRDLAKAGASIDVLRAVDQILVNEAEVAIRTTVEPDGKKSKKAVKRASQEALRAEIAKDARALLDLSAIHPVLAKRKVDAPRLSAMVATSGSLAGKLAERATAKGAQKSATSAMHDAVSEQKQVWGACYRLLAALGNEDSRVAQLLAEAARKRSKTKTKMA